MEKLKGLLDQTINEHFLKMIISNPRKKGDIIKVKVRPVLLKGGMYFQQEVYTKTQVRHQNIPWKDKQAFIDSTLDYMKDFKQLEWENQERAFTALVNRKQEAFIKSRKQEKEVSEGMEQFSHNRRKKYILEEGKPVDFLVELGVMNREGKVVKARYDKFRQINRFLEFVADVADELPRDRQVTIIDFGCGKSYLTFAMYYFLHILQNKDVRMIGLDLKKDVIVQCGKLAEQLGYTNLKFLHGDIAEYEGVACADMVVTLHACDTATDYALYKAVRWGAQVILSVPCCQHELNRQITCEMLKPMFRYGLIQERTAALFTDALRGNLLEQQGYQVQLLEFIDMEHTPKNILLRAVRRQKNAKADKAAYEACRDFLGAELTLEKLLR